MISKHGTLTHQRLALVQISTVAFLDKKVCLIESTIHSRLPLVVPVRGPYQLPEAEFQFLSVSGCTTPLSLPFQEFHGNMVLGAPSAKYKTKISFYQPKNSQSQCRTFKIVEAILHLFFMLSYTDTKFKSSILYAPMKIFSSLFSYRIQISSLQLMLELTPRH